MQECAHICTSAIISTDIISYATVALAHTLLSSGAFFRGQSAHQRPNEGRGGGLFRQGIVHGEVIGHHQQQKTGQPAHVPETGLTKNENVFQHLTEEGKKQAPEVADDAAGRVLLHRHGRRVESALADGEDVIDIQHQHQQDGGPARMRHGDRVRLTRQRIGAYCTDGVGGGIRDELQKAQPHDEGHHARQGLLFHDMSS